MQDHHQKALDEVFAQADLRKRRDAADKELRAEEKRKFDEEYVALVTQVVRPTFMEFQSYLATKGMDSFINYVPPYTQEEDDIKAEYSCRLTFGRKAAADTQVAYFEVSADPGERSLALQTQFKSTERIVKSTIGPNNPVRQITADVLHANLAQMLRVILT